MARRHAPSLPAAVTDLCGEAIRRASHIVVTVVSPDSRRHMAIDPSGRVRESTPPAPDTARPDLAQMAPRIGDRMPSGQSDADLSWVEERLLSDGEKPKRRRRWFRR
ncbi:hypothetical protein [Nocardioides pakistanensis]